MLLRYLYILRSSWPRTLELLYWPTLQMLIWGFMSQFLAQNSSYVAQAFGVLLAAVMLWDLLFRSQLGLSISFLEEMWSRNLGHLFVTPLRPYEWLISLLAMSVIRVTIGMLPAMLLAIPLYQYSIFDMGLPLVAFLVVLMVLGWALGLAICGGILRHGMGAESLAWTVDLRAGAAQLRLLPGDDPAGLAAALAWALPSTHVFEGMRAVLFEHDLPHRIISSPRWRSTWSIWRLGAAVFFIAFRDARRRGALLQMGEIDDVRQTLARGPIAAALVLVVAMTACDSEPPSARRSSNSCRPASSTSRGCMSRSRPPSRPPRLVPTPSSTRSSPISIPGSTRSCPSRCSAPSKQRPARSTSWRRGAPRSPRSAAAWRHPRRPRQATGDRDAARAALKQPDELKKVYDAAYDRNVTQPAKAFAEIFPDVDEATRTIQALADFLDRNSAKIKISGSMMQVADPSLQPQLQSLIDAMRAKQQALQKAQQRLRRHRLRQQIAAA